MPPAARISDMHVCPMVTGLVPHVGGPIAIGMPTVIIGGMPAARVGDMAVCVGPPDMIAMGSTGVFIGGMPAARMGDMTVHGGNIAIGFPTVMIGEVGGGGFGTGLGANVDTIVTQSPTLQANIEALQDQGYTIRYGEAGDGTYCDKEAKEIVIDMNSMGNAEDITQSLAHESGHALYTEDPYVPPDGLSRQEYIDQNVARHLRDEGEATLVNAEVRQEILDNGGPDIGIAGANAAEYERIYNNDPDPADRNVARDEIGQAFAEGEIPSGQPSGPGAPPPQNYGEYYGETYSDFWDENVAP